MAKVAIVIGNGFDLNLLLHTSYSDFAKSSEFKDIPKDSIFTSYIDTSDPEKSLYAHLQSAFDKQNWFDIEEEIYSFANHYSHYSPLLSTEFDCIRKALLKYLINVVNKTQPCQESLAYTFMKVLEESCISDINIYSFNYTDCLSLCDCQPNSRIKLYNIHGDLTSDIVLGFYDYKNIISNRICSFMDKTNMLKKAGFGIEAGLMEAEEIIFFGHSLNPMDFSYFKSFFDYVVSTKSVNKSLTFVCLDRNSVLGIKNNIQSQGYNPRDLYSHLKNFEFIRTHNWNERDLDDVNLNIQLCNRLKNL